MEPKEVIKTLKECTTLACEYHMKNRCGRNVDERENRLALAVSTAEKAIMKVDVPEAVAKRRNGQSVCPACRQHVVRKMIYRNGENVITEHCPSCGQRLNWEGENG